MAEYPDRRISESESVEKIVIMDGDYQCIGHGRHAGIYWISQNRAIKIPIYNLKEKGLMEAFTEEAYIQRVLWDEGIIVPRPYGVFPVVLNGVETQGLVMERIHGMDLDRLGFPSELINRGCNEIAKAFQTGFSPGDLCPQNMIYEEKTGRVVLVDFETWELGTFSNVS